MFCVRVTISSFRSEDVYVRWGKETDASAVKTCKLSELRACNELRGHPAF